MNLLKGADEWVQYAGALVVHLLCSPHFIGLFFALSWGAAFLCSRMWVQSLMPCCLTQLHVLQLFHLEAIFNRPYFLSHISFQPQTVFSCLLLQ